MNSKEVLNQSAEGFIAAIRDVHSSARDKQHDPVKVAANRLKFREIARVYAERLVDAARVCRKDDYAAIEQKVTAKLAEVDKAAIKILEEHDATISAMRALYGEPGAAYGMAHLSLAEREATTRHAHLLEEVNELKREGQAIREKQDNGPRDVYSVSALIASDPVTAAFYAMAYVDAAETGKLVD